MVQPGLRGGRRRGKRGKRRGRRKKKEGFNAIVSSAKV
jgi:hypothetical protein